MAEVTLNVIDAGSTGVESVGTVRMAGTFAWLVWCALHIWYLAGMRNRLKVLVDWVWHYIEFRPGSRVLTQEAGRRIGEPESTAVDSESERQAA